MNLQENEQDEFVYLFYHSSLLLFFFFQTSVITVSFGIRKSFETMLELEINNVRLDWTCIMH